FDGLQNVWNIWWVDHAVTQLHTSPWYTQLINYPFGSSLLGHTLNPLNGFLAIPLLRMLPLVQVFNLILLGTFVIGGMTTYWLARELGARTWPSLAAGFIYSFSSYHWAHGQGHLQLTS